MIFYNLSSNMFFLAELFSPLELWVMYLLMSFVVSSVMDGNQSVSSMEMKDSALLLTPGW